MSQEDVGAFLFLVAFPTAFLLGCLAWFSIRLHFLRREYARVFREIYGHDAEERPIPCALCDCPTDALEADDREIAGPFGLKEDWHRIRCPRCGHFGEWSRKRRKAIVAWNKEMVTRNGKAAIILEDDNPFIGRE